MPPSTPAASRPPTTVADSRGDGKTTALGGPLILQLRGLDHRSMSAMQKCSGLSAGDQVVAAHQREGNTEMRHYILLYCADGEDWWAATTNAKGQADTTTQPFLLKKGHYYRD